MSDREIMNAKKGLGIRLYPGDIEATIDEPSDRFVQSVKDKFEERSQTGIRKYNTTLEREDLDFVDWLNHLQEELMDATLYVEKLKSYAKEAERARKEGLGK